MNFEFEFRRYRVNNYLEFRLELIRGVELAHSVQCTDVKPIFAILEGSKLKLSGVWPLAAVKHPVLSQVTGVIKLDFDGLFCGGLDLRNFEWD